MYNVMPFGPANGSTTLIAWKSLPCQHNITINKDTNTIIIVDNILSYAETL
jgi:hypothetical protein